MSRATRTARAAGRGTSPRWTAYLPAVGLGVTQTFGYGVLFYTYAILLPHVARDLGISLSRGFGILSIALFVGGFVSPVAGRLVDRIGGQWPMTLGSLCAGVGMIILSRVQTELQLLLAVLFAEAAAMFVLYPVAFASVSRLDVAVSAQRSISVITLFGGVASTIFWPTTLALYERFGWRTTWVVLGIVYVLVCVPLHYAIFRGAERTDVETGAAGAGGGWPTVAPARRRRALSALVGSFILSGLVMSGMMALWVTNVQDLGHSAALAALAGAVIGPFKTVGRFFEALISADLYPRMTYALSLGLMVAAFAVLMPLGFTVPGVIVAAALYGMGDGINTIASGTLPLALFGGKGYGSLLGWIQLARNVFNASAPFTFALLTQRFGGWWSFGAMAICLVAAVGTFFFIPDPRRAQVCRPRRDGWRTRAGHH